MIHDYASRAHYHVIREVAREIANAGKLSVFQPLDGRIRSLRIEYIEAGPIGPCMMGVGVWRRPPIRP